jgi:large subunit ribosomal protein L24
MTRMVTPMKTRLKKGDEVVVISGKAKGQSGKITTVITDRNRVIVAGLNMAKVHVSARKAAAAQQEPGIVQKELSIAFSNVMLKDPTTGKPTKLGYRLEADGSKVRVAKASGTVVDTIRRAKDSTKTTATAKTAVKPSKSKSK